MYKIKYTYDGFTAVSHDLLHLHPRFSRITRVGRFPSVERDKKPNIRLWHGFLAGQRQITSTNTCFIHHSPNQSEHHATLPKIILNYPSVFKKTSVGAKFYDQNALPESTRAGHQAVHYCMALDT
jgi:hypothetical protein